MSRQKKKARTSWTSRYDDERRILKDQLEARGPILDPVSDKPWEDVPYDTYVQHRIDSEILNQVPSTLREQEELYLNEFRKQEEERYAKYRKDRDDAIDKFADEHAWAPKRENIPLLDKVFDVYDFITDNRPTLKQGYSKSVLNTAITAANPWLAISGVIKNFDWAKDVWNYHGKKMNDFQIGDYQGYIDRANVFNHLLESEKQAIEIEKEIVELDNQIALLTADNLPADLNTQQFSTPQQKQAYVNLLNDRKTELLKQHDELDEDREAFRSYEPGLLSLAINTGSKLFFPLRIISNNPVFGKTTEVRDELVDITRGLSDYDSTASFEDRLKLLNDIQLVYLDKLKEWNEGIDENLRDKESYGKVSDFFQHEADKGEIRFFHPDTYLIGLPGLVAGTTSSLNKQLPAMIMGFASGKAFGAAALTGDIGAFAGGVGGTLGTYALNYAAGISESNSEVSSKLTDKLRNALINNGLYQSLIEEGRRKLKNSDKLSDAEVFDCFRRGLFTTDNSAINKELFKQATGIENAFLEEMAAVTWDAAIHTGLEVLPLGNGAKFIKTPFGRIVKNHIRSNKYWRQVITSEPAKKFIRSNFGQRVFGDAAVGFNRGAVVSPVWGAINVPIHVALAPTERFLGNLVMKQVAKKLGWTSNVLSSMPEQTLGRALIGSTKARYMYDVTGRLIATSLSETIEEGKQGHIQNRFQNGEYDSNVIQSVWHTAFDDWVMGTRSAALILGMPFESMFSEEDREMLNEMKGGMLMGAFGHGTAINILSNVAPYVREQNANQFVVELFLNQKFENVKRFNKAVAYAEKSKDGTAYNSVLQAFDRLVEENLKHKKRTGNTAVDPKAIEDEIVEFKRTAQEANNLYTIKAAEQQGIRPGTAEYNQFVGAKMLAIHGVEDSRDAVNEAHDDLTHALTDIRIKYLEEAFDEALSAMPGNEQLATPQQPNTNKFGYSYADTLAHHVALLKRKQEIEVGILNAEAGNNLSIKAVLQEQLKDINDQLAFSKTVLGAIVNDKDALDSIDDIEKNLVYDRDAHDTLVPLWKEYLIRRDDLNLAVSTLNDVTGKMQISDKDGKNWRDLTNDDYADPESENNEGKFNPSKDIDRIRFVGGKAKEIIKRYANMVASDDRLLEDLLESHRQSVEASIQAVEEGAVDPKGNVVNEEKLNNIEQGVPEQPDPQEQFRQEVEEKPEQQVTEQQEPPREQNNTSEVSNSTTNAQSALNNEEPVVSPTTEQPTSEQPSTPKQEEQSQPAENALRPKSKYVDDADQEEFAKLKAEMRRALLGQLNAGINPDVLRIGTQMSYLVIKHGAHKFADYAKAMIEELGEAIKPHLKMLYSASRYMSGADQNIVSQMDDDAVVRNFDINSLRTAKTNQRQVVEAIRQRARESQDYVIEVTPEYYLIKVGDEEIRMPRVHSVMPKYWVDDEDSEHKNNNAYVQSSLQVGSAFDTLARIFFSDKSYMNRFANQETRQALIDELFHTDSEFFKKLSEKKLNKSFAELYKDRESFARTVEDLYNLAAQYDRLGWELVSEPIVWFNKFNKGYIAGETDMIAVDKDGNIHIIDFKTAKGNVPFERFFWARPELTQQHHDLLSTLTKEDFEQGRRGKGLSKKAIDVKKQINKALGTRNIAIVWNYATNTAEVQYINSNFYSTNGSLFRLGPKSQEYSDQLTAYAEMILSQMFNVVDLEIVGFRTTYSIDFDKVGVETISNLTNNVKGKPFRIKLSFSDEMHRILNNEGPIDQLPETSTPQEDSAEEKEIIQSTETQQLQTSDSVNLPVDGTTLAKPDEPNLDAVKAKRKDHNGSLDHTDLDYVRISHDQQFTNDTNAYDFIEWLVLNGAVTLYTEVVKGERFLYADINYKGHEYKRVYIQTHTRVNGKDVLTESGRYLMQRVTELEQTKKPGLKIVAARMNRTAGRVGVLPEGRTVTLTESDLLAEPNLSDIEFASSDSRFGFVKDGDVISFENGNPEQQVATYTFKGRNIPVPQNGALVFIKSTNHKERKTQEQIPITLTKAPLSEDFDFIIDCLRNIDQLDKPYVFTQNGETIRIEATRRQLLNLLIPYVDDISETENILSIVRDKNNPSVFYITSKNRTQSAAQVNVLEQESINKFKQQLAAISVTETPRMLTARLGDSRSSALPVFANVRKFFANKNNKVRSLNISLNLKFDFDDFKLTDSSKTPNRKNEGLSGLGWAIKSGWFRTNYGGMLASNVEIEDADIIDDKPIDVSTPTPIEDTASLLDSDPESMLDLLSGLVLKRATQFDSNKPKLTPELIKENLRPILGDIVDDPNILRIVTDIEYTNASAVGTASADAITIYNAAFAGVEYHEAFHRILELYVPEKTREMIYKKVAKQLGIDLSKSTKENGYYGHRIVAEKIADDYMDIKNGERKISRFNFINKAYNIIQDVLRIFKNLDNWRLYKLFLMANLGKFKNKTVSKEARDRFNTLFGGLNYEVHGYDFEHIANDVMYEEVVDSTFYLLTLGLNIDLSGANISDIQISRDVMRAGAEKLRRFGFDIFGKDGERTAGQEAMNEVYEKFYAVSDDLAARFSLISTDYIKRFEEAEREKMDGDEESIKSANYEEQIRASYEFSRFEKTSSRVKFFFSLLPQIRYTSEGRILFVTNSLGMPTLIPMNYVFNEVLTSLWDVDNLSELESRLADLAKGNVMFQMILNNVRKVISGRIVDGKVDHDKESLLTQLMTTIKSNRHTFMVARSERSGERYDIVLETSDADYNAKFFPMQWGQVLAKGGTEILKVDAYGRLMFNPKNKYASQLFGRIADFFDSVKKVGDVYEVGLKQMLSPTAFQEGSNYRMTVKVVDQEKSTGDTIVRKSIQLTDLRKPEQCSIIKDKIVEAFNNLGIRITSDEFDFMLRHKYGSADWEALRSMVISTSDKDSMGSFLQFLRTIVQNGRLNIDAEGNVMGMRNRRNAVSLEQAYSQMAFVKELGNWKWAYRHAHDQLSVLAINGNRFYEISDNDYISDVLRGLNKRDRQFDELKQDPYNYHIGEADALGLRTAIGSITLKQLSENPEMKLLLRHFIGFKTDKKGDLGSDYFEISRREDYLSKATILENGGIIMLTLSDKKKYCYIDGVKLPGFDYSALEDNDPKVREEARRRLSENIVFRPGIGSSKHQVQQSIDVINQMISYALAEYESVKKAGQKIDELERTGQLQQDVVNFYTLQQGARFSSLLGVWENTYDEEGNATGEQFISFNKSDRSWYENLAIAEAYFFDRTEEEQLALIARNLQHMLDKELDAAEELGLIQKFPSENPYLGYKNLGLNNSIISAILNSYKAKYPAISDGAAESLAVVMYLSDISAKAIMSGQETERLFSGNPAFYKWKYDKRGNLVDRTTDELKRLGGLGSTGTNNFLELENIPEKYMKDGKFTGKYIQAEVDNEMVSSPQIDEIRTIIYENQLKYSAYLREEEYLLSKLQEEYDLTVRDIKRAYKTDPNEMLDALLKAEREYKKLVEETKKQIADDIYKSSVQQIEESHPQVIELAKARANEVAEAYSEGIDIADGGAYITDEMCEMLLRMVGSYTKEVEKAFDILRGRVKADYLKQADAYNTVLTTVIGSQKYTAFGRRMQDGRAVPYYNKMALFPIFDCIATGRMRNIFEKMRQQGIDVLAVNSAVKLGSQGSKPVNWSDFRIDDDPSNEDNFVNGDLGSQNWKPVFEEVFSFNTYEQDFSALRKQLNTDPTEEKLMRAGTQMQKIVFSNMIEGKTYIGQDGSELTGLELRNRIMGAMNALSNVGLDKLNQRFFRTNDEGRPVNSKGEVIDRNSTERVLDVKKFVSEVSRMMSDRGADKNVMKALEYIQNQDENYIPLGAISNSSWIESVLISVINKEVIDVNTPGAFFIQRSVWGMEGQKMVDRSKGQIIGATLYDGKELLMINNKNSMDCVLSLDFFEHILPQVPVRDEDGRIVYQINDDGSFKLNNEGNRIPEMRKMSFDEAKKWLIDHNIIGENANANIVGYRIPTQAESSIHALRCVDVLPVVRDTVILPKEFTKITGSDFKLILKSLNFFNCWKPLT